MEQNSESNVSGWVDDRLATLRPDDDWPRDPTGALARFHRQRAAKNSHGGYWIWAAALAMTVVVALLAFPAPRVLAQRCVNACESLFVNRTAAVADPAIGTAPDFTLKDANGAEVRLSALRGKIVLLNFWATWCVPCQVEIPWFAEFQRAYQSQGFEVLGVSMDDDGWKSVKPFLELKKIDYPVAVGNDTVAHEYGGLDALPETLLIDKHGRIASRHVGLVSKSVYRHEILRLLGTN